MLELIGVAKVINLCDLQYILSEDYLCFMLLEFKRVINVLQTNKIGINLALLFVVFSWVLWGCSSLKQPELKTGQQTELASQEKIKERKVKLKTMGTCINKLHSQLESQWKMSSFSEEETRYAGEFLNVLLLNYESYVPDSAIIVDLKRIEQPFMLRVFGGNWCSDTHAGVPALYKVLDLMGLNAQRIEYTRVGKNKIPVDLRPASLDEGVGPVPLVIVMNNQGKEIGRIIEVPKKSWEKDLLTILESNGIR
jgi:hypothetical protein